MIFVKKILIVCFFVGLLAGCTPINSLKDSLAEIDIAQVKEDWLNSDTEESIPEGDIVFDEGQASESSFEGPLLEESFFNEIETVDGKAVIQNASNPLALVNKMFGLPSEYFPEDLVTPDVSFSFANKDVEKSKLRQEAGEALERMFTEAEQSGIMLYAVSGYRSYDRQEALFIAEVNKTGEELAAEAVAEPGYSEHQTGLAMDISSRSVGLSLTENFGETPEGKWLEKNAHKYGFILRYPKGKEEITGFMYEPWHFRYVGQEAATDIYHNNWTLEEYFDLARKVKDSV